MNYSVNVFTNPTYLTRDLAWLLYGWSLPAGTALPDGVDTTEFALWEVKARGILSVIADQLKAAGHEDAAKLLASGQFRLAEVCIALVDGTQQ